MDNEKLQNLRERKRLSEFKLTMLQRIHVGSSESLEKAIDQLLDEIIELDRQIKEQTGGQ